MTRQPPVNLKVGFTGSRDGMSLYQGSQLADLFSLLMVRDYGGEFHYGTHAEVVLKADEQAAKMAAACGFRLRPYHAVQGGELLRNRRIVEAVDLLVAAPATDREIQRSGTWATVRYARRKTIMVVMLSRGQEVER